MDEMNHDELPKTGEDRRQFLKSCGRFAAVTPPVVSLLLSTSLSSEAIARSGGGSFHGRGRSHEHSFFRRGRR